MKSLFRSLLWREIGGVSWGDRGDARSSNRPDSLRLMGEGGCPVISCIIAAPRDDLDRVVSTRGRSGRSRLRRSGSRTRGSGL